MEAGTRILPEPGGARGDRDLRRAARGDPAPRLPAHRAAEQRYVCAGGIRSTGITGSLAIAEWVREALASAGLDLAKEPETVELRMPNIGEFGSRPYQDGELIERDPDYGRIVCFCERVTRGEIGARAGRPDPTLGCGRPATPHPCADGSLPGILLRGRGDEDLEGADGDR